MSKYIIRLARRHTNRVTRKRRPTEFDTISISGNVEIELSVTHSVLKY